MEDVKNLASSMMHMHYCDHDMEGITALFSPQFSWLGTGEEECLSGQEACTEQFLNYGGIIPKCMIWDEEYDVIVPVKGVYVVMGRMWIATDPNTEMYLKVHQRVTFVFQDTDEGLRCSHIHCSNPYQELLEGELFPDKIGRQSYEYVQERLQALEAEKKQQNRQMEVIMSSIAGGLKISNDDDTYSFAFVSREAAGLFGYTVEEFMEATGGTAVGTVYPPDLEQALSDCAEAFKDGGLEYSTKYRVRCKDGSLKWIIDSGKKAQDADGNWMVNSLYLDITGSEEDAQRLREQTELLTSIYDTVPCGIIRFVQCSDGSYRLISLNEAVVLLMGYHSVEEGMGDWQEGMLGAVNAEDREILHEIYYGLEKVGDYKDNEYRVIWKDGSVHWMQGTTMIVGTTSEGENILQRTVVDITQRKVLQEQLNREQEMYRVAMEVSSAVMFEYDMDTDRFISYEPITGEGVLRNEIEHYSKALLEQKIVHPDDVPMVVDNICKGRTEVFEVRCSTPRTGLGSYLWYRVNGRLVMENGKPARVVGALYNIHRMKSELSENSERLYMNQSALQAINGVYVSIFYVNLGSQTGPLLGEELFREFLYPYLKQLADLGREYGLPTMMHCCGSYTQLMPALIESGISAVQSLQPITREMQPAYLKKHFGERLILNGCIDSISVLINGSIEDAVRVTRETIKCMKPGGGYILSPSHDYLLEETPLENVLAMYDTCLEDGWYTAD